ncbi:MAG: ABC transporter ATP-binding protein [Gammaproteobacteria bacterium]|nr:ABC transporter ATP-binding protein [Gammaproteobacteria bacterium]
MTRACGADGAPAVELRDVSRRFGDVRALGGVSFSVREGEFFSMLGPSGSGKTTCLRLIAGFDEQSGGDILLFGNSLTGVPPYRRNINTVFQDYALFPHLSVADNVAYGLMIRGERKRERLRKAGEMLALVNLSGMEARRPAALSGGQRQRVALARALIMRPRVLLLDEPLGALDLKLREQMQSELKALQRRLGITFIYVTHDQHEALGLSDRVAVFNDGSAEQIDTPQRLYERPRTAFVARFVGASNIIDGALAERLCGRRAAFSIRPEKMVVSPGDQVPVRFTVRVRELLYHGANARIEFGVAAEDKLAAVCAWRQAAQFAVGDSIEVGFAREDAVFFDA